MTTRQTTRKSVSIGVSILCTLASLAPFAAQAQKPGSGVLSDEPTRVIVKFKDGTSEARVREFQQRLGTRSVKRLAVGNLQVQEVPRTQSIEQTIRELEAQPEVEYAEPDWIVHINAVPNDPYFPQLWGMSSRYDTDIDGPEAWDLVRDARSVVVGVIDTGVDYTHPDLAANMWRNPGEVVNGRDDDGNGYVDDIHGIDCTRGSGDPMDRHYHGTHVAGTIGAVGSNGYGVSGVAWQASIMALRFLDENGSGTTSDAIECIQYATMMRKRFGVNVRVTNNSWGGGGFSKSLESAIKDAWKNDILFVAAAGNDSTYTDYYANYPSGYEVPNVISVAASDENDWLAYFSNWGPESVDVAAPGTNILSTVPGGGFAHLQGTSMASPHVSGTAALLAARLPAASPDMLRFILMYASDPLTSLSGVVQSGSRLNTWYAVYQGADPNRASGAVAGKSLSFSDGGTAAKRKLKVEIQDPTLSAPSSDTFENPIFGGAVLRVANPFTGERTAIVLESKGWKQGKGGWKYKGMSPCKVSVKAGGYKADCKGAAIGFTLDEPAQGALDVDFEFGNGARYCAVFGGAVSKDNGIGYGAKPGAGKFEAKGAPAAFCTVR